MKNNKTLNLKSLILCSLFAALIAIGAFIRIPIPILAFTLQFLFTNLAGILLGKKLGAISVGIYLLLGLIGIPVFLEGGGLMYVVKPSFGYLIGFLLGAYLTGYIVERVKTITVKKLFLAGLSGLSVVYILGMIYYFIISNFYLGVPIGVKSVLVYCFLVFVPGDVFLCFVSALISKKILTSTKNFSYI